MIPVRVPFFLPYIYPSLTWRIESPGKDLFLTFDDGPVPGPTEFVLDTLAEYECLATFFCIGDNIRKNTQVFQRVIAGGHTVGNHTFHHLNGWKTSLARYLEDVGLCQQEIARHAGTRSMLFRPPYGRISFRAIRAMKEYQIVMWDVLTKDYDHTLSPEECLRGSIAATRSGSVIVFHDSLKAYNNLRYVLPRFIRHFAGQGFRFKAIPA